MATIKACPFCGCNSGLYVEVDVNAEQYAVHCPDCGCNGPIQDSKNEAIDAWNLCYEEVIQTVKIHKILDVETPISNGACYDLFTPADVTIQPGETKKIGLGVAMKLPKDFHAKIYMRSSTWGKWGLMLTNNVGIIDNSYCGNDDEWILSVTLNSSAKEAVTIPKGTRLAQFELVQNAPEIGFVEVDSLDDESRGGFGSTGE